VRNVPHESRDSSAAGNIQRPSENSARSNQTRGVRPDRPPSIITAQLTDPYWQAASISNTDSAMLRVGTHVRRTLESRPLQTNNNGSNSGGGGWERSNRSLDERPPAATRSYLMRDLLGGSPDSVL
jgi:hypothetical protein